MTLTRNVRSTRSAVISSEPHLEIDRARVVDQHRRRAELGIDGGEHALHVVFAADVRLNRHRSGAEAPHLIRHPCGGGGVPPIADRHVVSRVRPRALRSPRRSPGSRR